MRQRQKESENIPKFGSLARESTCLPALNWGRQVPDTRR